MIIPLRDKPDERGTLNVLLIPLILLILLFFSAVGFAVWAYNSRQDYKTNVDAKINQAVTANTETVQKADAKQAAEAAKLPLKTYHGPESYGSVSVSYPKTWSAYVDSSNTSTPVNGYFYPDFVPSVQAQSSVFALRVQVLQTSYSQIVSQFSSTLSQNKVTITPYKFAKVPSVIGVRVDGQIALNKQGSMVIVPLRDKTLEISTEANSFMADFNTSVLPNVSFSP